MIKALQEPEIGILKVKLGVSEPLIRYSNLGKLVDFVDSGVYMQENEGVFDVSEVVEFDLLENVKVSLLVIGWKLLLDHAHLWGSFVHFGPLTINFRLL